MFTIMKNVFVLFFEFFNYSYFYFSFYYKIFFWPFYFLILNNKLISWKEMFLFNFYYFTLNLKTRYLFHVKYRSLKFLTNYFVLKLEIKIENEPYYKILKIFLYSKVCIIYVLPTFKNKFIIIGSENTLPRFESILFQVQCTRTVSRANSYIFNVCIIMYN